MNVEDIRLIIQESINKINEILINDIKQIEQFSRYDTFTELCESKGIAKVSRDDYNLLKDDIKKLDCTKLKEFLDGMLKYYNELLDSANINWNDYNENYKNMMLRELQNLKNILFSHNISNVSSVPISSLLNIFKNYYDNLININIEKKNVLENFAYTNKNYVVFGKNGSGKTSLLNHVKGSFFNSNSFVIPANRSIKIGRLSNITQEYSKDLNSLFNNSSYDPLDILSLMMYDRDYIDMKNGVSEKIMDKFIDLFNSLNLERKIVIKDKKIYLYNENISEYYAVSASDGEKTIMLYIMYVLFLPQHAYLFIDEPENHLNGALLSELFDILEKEREDVIFIYFTHNIDFIETRSNVSLIHLDKFNSNNEWVFNKITDFQEIPVNLLIKIIGTKKTILFVEGKKGSFDFKIYSVLFPEFKVLAVDSCQKVIDNCRSIRSNKILCREAYGIVDNDFRDQSEIEDLKADNIFVLTHNELENLILNENILTYIAQKMGHLDKIEEVKKDIIDHAKLTKDGIIQDFIGKTYNRIIKTSKINYEGDMVTLESKIEEINNKNKAEFLDKLKEFVAELDLLISNSNYELLIKRLPNKGFVSKATKLGFYNPDFYVDFLTNMLKEDENFRNEIRNKYFLDLLSN